MVAKSDANAAANAAAKAVLLLGPTACGKSAFASRIAQEAAQKAVQDAAREMSGGVEIVSIDSAQVYRGLDIGSAKPTPAERAAIPHHLIDIRDPAQPYSAAEFYADAMAAIDEISARGKLALIVGGSMMYARVLRQGIADLPSADAVIRNRIQAEAQAIGWPALHERLTRIDPATAQRLAPADRQRIGRALEVFESSGRRMSDLLADSAHKGIPLRTIALLPEDRALLHLRIERRFDAMLAAGFLEEVRTLRARPDLHGDLPALRSVGYRQAWAHLETGSEYGAFRAAAIAATRQLAKRQMTWLRSMSDALFIDPFTDIAPEQLRRAVLGDRQVNDRTARE